jgi:starch synthase
VTSLTVLSVASELYPLVKTGGLADVVGALPAALVAEDVRVATLLPGYPAVFNALEEPEAVGVFDDLYGGPARLLRGRVAGLDVMALDAPHLYDRPGNPYVGPDGLDWPDNAQRFAALARVAAEAARGRAGSFTADLVHAHDWQAGLVPAYLHYGGGPPSVITIHNLAFQGRFPPYLFGSLGLPPAAWSIEGVEYYGGVGYLKSGLALADAVTTVSPTYAAEIRTFEGGMGLHGLLRARSASLTGILNGIDVMVWNPATDALLPARYDADEPSGRAICKAALQARLGLADAPDTLLYGVISRLTWQKGMDVLISALPTLLASGAQLAVLGAGDRPLEEAFAAAVAAHPGQIGCVVGYDEGLAHLIQAGSDALLVPSRFEPCGLTQLCALRYGALPVVSRVGGLADTVVDANEMALEAGSGTGVMFAPPTREMLEAALLRTSTLWRDRAAWHSLQRNAMRTDVSWRRPAARYAALFRGLVAARAA